MSATLGTGNGSAPDHSGKATTEPERQASLQQALRTLRAIWQRYEIDRMRNSELRARVVHVALGHSDMCWITAAIGALEEAVAAAAKTPGQPQR
jgi:hypothetical protein